MGGNTSPKPGLGDKTVVMSSNSISVRKPNLKTSAQFHRLPCRSPPAELLSVSQDDGDRGD